MTPSANIELKKSRTIAFVFPSVMAAFKNEVLMGMAQYAQRRRNIVLRCIEESHLDEKDVFAECDGIFTDIAYEKELDRMAATAAPEVPLRLGHAARISPAQ